MIKRYQNKFIKVFLVTFVYALLVGTLSFFAFRELPNLTVNSANFQIIQFILMVLPWAILISIGLNIWCCYLLAKAKGYSGWLSLLGFFNLLGLALLFLLDDRHK